MNNVLVAVQQLIDKQKAEIAELKATSLKSAEIIISYESQIDMLAIDVTESEAEIAELTKGFNVLDNLLTLSNKRNNEAVGSLKAQAAEIAELRQDVAFYRCCALCGEIPDDSQKPSIKNKEQE